MNYTVPANPQLWHDGHGHFLASPDLTPDGDAGILSGTTSSRSGMTTLTCRLPISNGSAAISVIPSCTIVASRAICLLLAGDEDLLPAALAILAKIHAKGVIHGDLNPECFLVNEADVGKGAAKNVVLIHFSHCSFNVGKEDQGKEIAEMKALFESL